MAIVHQEGTSVRQFIVGVIGATMGLMILTGCLSVSSSSSNSDSAGSIGQTVRDGKFEFLVTNVDTTKPGVIAVHLKVTNIGDEAQIWSSGNQKLLVDGKEFDSDLFESSESYETLNPGLGVDAVVGFKVPPGTVPDAIELHDSMFSQGVKVRL